MCLPAHFEGRVQCMEDQLPSPGAQTMVGRYAHRIAVRVGIDDIQTLSLLSAAGPIVGRHHVVTDDPHSLPPAAQILEIIDIYNHMVFGLPDDEALRPEEAICALRHLSGMVFHEGIVEAFAEELGFAPDDDIMLY